MAFVPFWKNRTLGVDICAGSIKVVETAFSGGRARVLRAACTELSPGLAQLPLEERRAAYAAELKALLHRSGIRTRRAAVALPACDADLKILKFSKSGGVSDVGTGETSAPNDAPFSSGDNQTYTQPLPAPQPLPGGLPTEAEVLLVTGSKTAARERLAVARLAGLRPAVADVDALAALNVYLLDAKPSEGLTVIIDLGADTTNITVVERAMVRIVRTIFVSNANITRTIQERLGLTESDASELKQKLGLSAPSEGSSPEAQSARHIREILSEQIDQISAEVSRTLAFLSEGGPEPAISSVVLMGDSAYLPGLPEYLGKKLGAPAGIFKALSKLHSACKMPCDGPKCFAVAAGLSLRDASLEERLATRVNLIPEQGSEKPALAGRVAVYALIAALAAYGYQKYGAMQLSLQAQLARQDAALSATADWFRTARRPKPMPRPEARPPAPKPAAPKARHAYLGELKISGVFSDSAGATAILNGSGGSYEAKNGKLYTNSGEAVPGVSAQIKQKTIVLSAGEEKYELPIPD